MNSQIFYNPQYFSLFNSHCGESVLKFLEYLASYVFSLKHLWVTAFDVYLVSVFISYGTKEFAKLRALRAYVPYVSMRLTCLRAFVPQINACLRAYVPLFFTCLRALIFHVLTCLQPLTKYIEAHFYTLHCCFSLDYLQKQPPEVFFKKRCS